MDKEIETVDFEYGKWQGPEDSDTAFESVKSGKWDLARFDKWVRQVQVEEYRSATADESM